MSYPDYHEKGILHRTPFFEALTHSLKYSLRKTWHSYFVSQRFIEMNCIKTKYECRAFAL